MSIKSIENIEDIIDDIEQYIIQNLRDDRFAHSKNVAILAKKLATRFGENEIEAYLMGIAHDILREKPDEELISMAVLYNCLEPYGQEFPAVLHGRLAAFFVKDNFNFYSKKLDIAMYNHSTASYSMDNMSKILYVADMYEFSRPYVNEDIRLKLETLTLGELYNMAIIQSVNYMKSKDIKIVPITLEIYNSIMEK